MKFFLMIVLSLFGSQDNENKKNSHLKTLDQYTRSFHGWTFVREDGYYQGRTEVSFSNNKAYSPDGKVAASWGQEEFSPPIHGEEWVRSYSLDSVLKGFSFIASINSTQEKPICTVSFYKKGEFAPIASRALPCEGYMGGLTFAGFANESSVSLGFKDRDGTRYSVMTCKHPMYGIGEFYFDSREGLLRFVERRFKPGDVDRPSSLYETREAAPPGLWGWHRYGPIKYARVDGELKVSEIPSVDFDSESNKEHSSFTRFSAYTRASESLTDVIGNDYLAVDGDRNNTAKGVPGARVYSQGEPLVHYELRNGLIVKVADAPALLAARRAEFYRSGQAGNILYAFLGAVFLVAVFVFVWRRRTNDGV